MEVHFWVVGDIMRMAAIAAKWAVPCLLVAALWGADTKGKTATLKGYVLDSACAFTKGLEKPISLAWTSRRFISESRNRRGR